MENLPPNPSDYGLYAKKCLHKETNCVSLFACDVAKKEAVQSVVDTCVERFGTVDILVNKRDKLCVLVETCVLLEALPRRCI